MKSNSAFGVFKMSVSKQFAVLALMAGAALTPAAAAKPAAPSQDDPHSPPVSQIDSAGKSSKGDTVIQAQLVAATDKSAGLRCANTEVLFKVTPVDMKALMKIQEETLSGRPQTFTLDLNGKTKPNAGVPEVGVMMMSGDFMLDSKKNTVSLYGCNPNEVKEMNKSQGLRLKLF